MCARIGGCDDWKELLRDKLGMVVLLKVLRDVAVECCLPYLGTVHCRLVHGRTAPHALMSLYIADADLHFHVNFCRNVGQSMQVRIAVVEQATLAALKLIARPRVGANIYHCEGA